MNEIKRLNFPEIDLIRMRDDKSAEILRLEMMHVSPLGLGPPSPFSARAQPSPLDPGLDPVMVLAQELLKHSHREPVAPLVDVLSLGFQLNCRGASKDTTIDSLESFNEGGPSFAGIFVVEEFNLPLVPVRILFTFGEAHLVGLPFDIPARIFRPDETEDLVGPE